MRVRATGYSDYGLTREDVYRLKNEARKPENAEILMSAAKAVYPAIAHLLTRSLSRGESWNRLYRCFYVPISEGSFYGYRRKVLHVFGQKLKG